MFSLFLTEKVLISRHPFGDLGPETVSDEENCTFQREENWFSVPAAEFHTSLRLQVEPAQGPQSGVEFAVWGHSALQPAPSLCPPLIVEQNECV